MNEWEKFEADGDVHRRLAGSAWYVCGLYHRVGDVPLPASTPTTCFSCRPRRKQRELAPARKTP